MLNKLLYYIMMENIVTKQLRIYIKLVGTRGFLLIFRLSTFQKFPS